MSSGLSEIDKYFHEMFKFWWDEYRRNGSSLVVNPTRRKKKFADEDVVTLKLLDFEIFGNVSSFGIYEILRLAVFEKFLRRSSYLNFHSQGLNDVNHETSSLAEEYLPQLVAQSSEIKDVSKVIKIGVRSIFELIKGSRTQFPDLCVNAVGALLTLLEGLKLEALSDEPTDIIDDIFNILLNVVEECLNEEETEKHTDSKRLVEIASACLLSFAIIRGDTGKMLRAVCTILVSKHSTTFEMVLPNAVIEMQRSVQSFMIGQLKRPNWFTHGVLKSSCVSTFRLMLPADDSVIVPLKIKNIACDGNFLYLYTTHGLYKIGTGYNGTIPRNIYTHNKIFFNNENGWIGYIKKTLYFSVIKSTEVTEIHVINTNTLKIQSTIQVDVNVDPSDGLIFVDEDNLCLLSSGEENTFVIQFFDIDDQKVSKSRDDLCLKISKNYFKLFFTVCGHEEIVLSNVSVSVCEELTAFASGKEFSLLQTSGGKVFYNNKLSNQNLRAEGGLNIGNWMELACPKLSTVKQCVIGNEGSIGLLVYDDGSVYFIGFARRGEDGENGIVRRQCSQIKPRRMTRMEDRFVTYAACNHGSTALVTNKGELYMFGKDAIHCETGTGFVSDLKNVRVRQVALGKVHVVVLTDRGHVYTFGYNGREQCGRPSDSGRYETYSEVAGEEDEIYAFSDDNYSYSDVVCPKGTHVFKQDKCMICPVCNECTGYGANCMARNEAVREPGEECGCGDGESGCAKCCICKMCAFEDDPEQKLDDDVEPDDLNRVNLYGFVGDQDRRVRAELLGDKNSESHSFKDESNEGNGRSINANTTYGDSSNMVYLTPARVHFRTNAAAVQIAAGLYHSVVLMENGEVYTFGSNAFGQLGVSDANHVGPVRANLPPTIVQVAAGSNHTVALTSEGEVYTFGNNLSDNPVGSMLPEGSSWSNIPKLIPQIGAQHYEKAIGVGASGDMTYLKIDKSLFNATTLRKSVLVAENNHILLLPVQFENTQPKPFESIAIEKSSGKFKSFHGLNQVDFTNCVVCFDSLYNVLWSINEVEFTIPEHGAIVFCYNIIASEVNTEFCSPNILDCELAVPVVALHPLPCYQTAIHVLAGLDVLAQAREKKDVIKSLLTEKKRVINTKSLRKEDFTAVNRFEVLGNSWTYNNHNAIEAIRISSDTDVLLGGVGLYGGRGHYQARIKLYGPKFDNDPEFEEDLLISTEETAYECSLKQIFSFMFEEPVLLQAKKWYTLCAQIKGSPSDCGSSGRPYIVTDDEVIFHFKSSLLSNNGTGVSSGQIPQLLYKILTPEYYVTTNSEDTHSANVHVLSKKFSHSVSEDGFRSIIDLLSWCWEAFKLKYEKVSNLKYSPLLLESVRQFDRLVYINQACQHLLRAFIMEMYPEDCRTRERRTQVNCATAEIIGDIRALLQRILSDPFLFENFVPQKDGDGNCNIFYKLVKHILRECSKTFESCFYVFYPTPSQKWIYLCFLLNFRLENSYTHDFLIMSTLSAIYSPNCHLRSIFPILLGAFDPIQLFQQNKSSFSQYFHNFHPVLSKVITARTEIEIPISTCSWLDIVDRLLEMASKPSEDSLCGVQNAHNVKIALNSCQVLSKLVAELSAEAMGINNDVQRRKAQMLHTTPIRFRRVNSNKTWNTGNGSPDAICFTVDKAGIVIVGVGVFGGSGNYDYEIELMEEVFVNGKSNSEHNLSNPHAHWKCIALCRGSFSSADYNGKDIVELNFEYPTSIQENIKYTIKLRLRGNRTNNGELGQAIINGPDDTVFSFLSTDVSFNGTSISRGQLPYIIYYRYPQRSEEELKQKLYLETQAREAIIAVSTRIFNNITSILMGACKHSTQSDTIDSLGEIPLISVLVPFLVTHLSPLVALNPKNACQLLKLIEKVLPLVCTINRQIVKNSLDLTKNPLESMSSSQVTSNLLTTSSHYSVVESDHPYKRATVSKYVVKFPEAVMWLSMEFDPRCGTTQEEDVLKIYVPDHLREVDGKVRKLYHPLPRTYGNNKHSWPSTAVILPGNEVIFSLESASKYSSHDRGTSFGFRCMVIGFEMVDIDGFPRLELELNSLACRCASYLIKKNYWNSLQEADEFGAERINIELAESDYKLHASILNRGIDLYRQEITKKDQMTLKISESPNDSDLLDPASAKFPCGELNERSFLLDFIGYKADTSGGRLARWLQPNSFVDVNNCEVVLPRVKVLQGWPTSLAIAIRDQYKNIVEVPDLKVKVVCTPLTKKYQPPGHQSSEDNDSEEKLDYSVPYEPVTTNRVRYASITFIKEYNNYSFEEIRYATPNATLAMEHPSVTANHNGIFTANWTPKEVGLYSVNVNIDGFLMTELDLKIEVTRPPNGITPPTYMKSSSISNGIKKLKFAKRYSSGLRIRAQPSLQAEQIGIIDLEGLIEYNDEIENEDGIWVKLTHECITRYCQQLFPEAWSLKYNKHYECELLSLVDDREQLRPNQHPSAQKPTTEKIDSENENSNKIKIYQVVKCGISGHNIRAYPSLKAPTVGMIYAEQKVTSDEQILNREGVWIKLDKDSVESFDLNLQEDESAWSLAVDKSQIVYLKIDSNFSRDHSEKKQRHHSRSFSQTTPVSKGDRDDDNNDDSGENQVINQNVVNFNVPPTPKKRRQLSILSTTPVTSTSSSSGLNTTSDLADASSSFSSNDGCDVGSKSPEIDKFLEKLERATNECLAFNLGISCISESSGNISSGYQASIETSSDSNLLFKSQSYSMKEEEKPTLAQVGTQTSPRIYVKLPNKPAPERVAANDPPHHHTSSNVNTQQEEFLEKMHDVDELFDDTVLRVETVEHVPLRRKQFDKVGRDSVGNGNEETSDNDEDSVMLLTEIAAIDFEPKRYDTMMKSDEKSINSNDEHLPFEPYQISKDEIVNFAQQKEFRIQCKTGMSPSMAESMRAVFAAFLWHEGLVHDAMTCASFLKFHPDLRKDEKIVVKRSHKTRCKDATQRYSVEVGLSGNCHHPIKPSTMRSLSSSTTRDDTENDDEPAWQVPPVALEYVAILWDEINATCTQLFTKNTSFGTAHKSGNDIRESAATPKGYSANENKKYASKLATDFYKKFRSEDLCELCNARFPFPVTYHMRMVHKGCGKLGVTKGYNMNGKYGSKFKGSCGEGGKKSSLSYVLCDECRECYLLNRKKANSFVGFSPVSEESTTVQVSTETHLVMKENALFALELSANYNKLMPVVQTLPRLKTFSCLPTFGIDSNMLPSEMHAFSVEWEKQMRDQTYTDCEKEETVNVVNSFQRSVSMIGRSWKVVEDHESYSGLQDPCSFTIVPNKRYSAYDLENINFAPTNQSSAKLEALLKDMKSSSPSGDGSKLDRPIIAFLSEYHNLQNLKRTIKAVIKKAMYKNYGLRAMDWLLRTVTSPVSLHDIMWWFIHSFSVPLQAEDIQNEEDGEWNDEFDLTQICEHPLVDMALAGEARHYIPYSFHTLLQTIADLMLIFPVGSSLQQIAIKCWGFQFTQSDYNFLHRSKLFMNISKILSRSESEEEQECTNISMYESHLSTLSQTDHYVEVLRDVTPRVSISVSSHFHLLNNLIDNSTETYWESGEEDRRKMKTILINCPPEVNPHIVYLHADNTRDTNHKLLNVMVLTGEFEDNPRKLKNITLDGEFCGWISVFIPEPHQRLIRIDCKGENVLRVRQIKITGEIEGESPRILQMPCSFILQQRQCECETLKVFRLIIFQVFGELIENYHSDSQRSSEQRGSSDLREHMVGILFSRRKLNNLQKQVCTHIVQTIKQETVGLRDVWERHAQVNESNTDLVLHDINDSYCFEMLCMLSALSGSDVGRSYLAQQLDLISDLLTLLHVGTTRLQRQVVLLLRRVLPEVSPEVLAQVMKISSLPTVDFLPLVSDSATSFDANKQGILDIFLCAIAKNLIMQMKAKNGTNGKALKTVHMSDYILANDLTADQWFFKGTICKELSVEVNSLLKDMSMGKLSFNWQETTKAAVAENILNLANLSKVTENPDQCLRYPLFWIGLASLSVIDEEHVEKLSSANWRKAEDSSISPRPMCSNHDDDQTLAVMQCNICGLLCLECDRFLHLSRRAATHERRVCKEEEEAIKVNLYEGCGRVKLFWLLALVDSNSFKGVVEFREKNKFVNVAKPSGLLKGVCRFCGRADDNLTQLGTCYERECLEYMSTACNKVHSCGHICGGIRDEEVCLPCLQGCSVGNATLKQDADDMCMICFTEALSAAPSIQLECGHVFHYHCCENVLLKRWPGPRITFNFQQCPICKRSMYHDSMKEFLTPVWDLMKEVRKKALMRLEYEGCPSNYDNPAVYAMEKYAYYVCFKCKKAYYGGEARCEAEVDNSDFNPEELICGGCSDVSGARVCPKHGTDFLEYKCRYCCSVAVYFCFGTTHFCNGCHEDFQKVIYMTSSELPKCPAGPKGTKLKMEDCPLHIKHPPTGEEFALGCGVCRTGRNF